MKTLDNPEKKIRPKISFVSGRKIILKIFIENIFQLFRLKKNTLKFSIKKNPKKEAMTAYLLDWLAPLLEGVLSLKINKSPQREAVTAYFGGN